MRLPLCYLSSSYTQGDIGLNVRFQCEVFNELFDSQLVLPVAPLWSHWQHILFPRSYEDWMRYDLGLIETMDACLRLKSRYSKLNYYQFESAGADRECARFKELGKPVFYSTSSLYTWARETWPQLSTSKPTSESPKPTGAK